MKNIFRTNLVSGLTCHWFVFIIVLLTGLVVVFPLKARSPFYRAHIVGCFLDLSYGFSDGVGFAAAEIKNFIEGLRVPNHAKVAFHMVVYELPIPNSVRVP